MMGATDWALRRLLKFALRRWLRKWFEIDLDQLSVQLGSGRVEFKDVLLNIDQLNERLGLLPFRIVEGYVGSVRLTIPLTALYSESWRVDLEDVFVTVEPAPPICRATPAQATQAPPAEDARSAVGEGVRLIAGGLEAILQRLRATVTRVVVRVNLPRDARDAKLPPLAATLRLQCLGYAPVSTDVSDQEPTHSTGIELRKSVEATGLTVGLELAEDVEDRIALETATGLPSGSTSEERSGSPGRGSSPCASPCDLLHPILGDHNSGPCSVGVLLALSRDSRASSRSSHASASVLTEDIHVTLSAAQIACLAEAASLWSALVDSAPPATSEDGEGTEPFGTRSLIESIILPDCERAIYEAAGPSLRGGAGDEGGTNNGDGDDEGEEEEDEEFFDACSQLAGSMHGSQIDASQMATTEALSRVHALVESAHEDSVPLERTLRVELRRASISLLYPDTVGEPSRLVDSAPDRLWLELLGVCLAGKVSRGTISATARVSNVQACECLLRRDADENPHTEHASLVDRAVAPNVAFGGDASPFATPPRAGVHPLRGSSSVTGTMNRLRSLQRSSLPFQCLQTERWALFPLLHCSSAKAQGSKSAGRLAQDAVLATLLCDDDETDLCVASRPVAVWLDPATVERLMAAISAALPTEDASAGAGGDAELAPAPWDDPPPSRAFGARVFLSEVWVTLPGSDAHDCGDVHVCACLAVQPKLRDRIDRVLMQGSRRKFEDVELAFRALDAYPATLAVSKAAASPGVPNALQSEASWSSVRAALVSRAASTGTPARDLSARKFFDVLGTSGASGVQVHMQLGPAAPVAIPLDDVWVEALERLEAPPGPASAPEPPLLSQVTARADSDVTVFVPCVKATLTQQVLVALSNLAERILDVMPPPLPCEAGACQTNVALQCDRLVVDLETRGREKAIETYRLTVQKAEVTSLSGLCGCQGASWLSATMRGVMLLDARGRVLVHSPARSSVPSLKLDQVTRPRSGTVLVLPGRRLVYPCQAALVATADGFSISLDCEDGLVGWAERLGELFNVVQGPEELERDASPRCLMNVAACLRDGAVRLDPPASDSSLPSASAALVVREVLWRRLALSSSEYPLVARSCEVFLAAPSVREGSWLPHDPVHIPSLDLTAMGYHRIVSEGKVVVHFGRQIGEPLVRVSGDRLAFSVSQTTATLAQRLAEVVSQALARRAAAAAGSNVDGAGQEPSGTSVRHSGSALGGGAEQDSLAALDLARGRFQAPGRSASVGSPALGPSEDGNGAWIEPFVLNESYVARPTETDDAAVPTACVLDCRLNLVVDMIPRDGNTLRLAVSGIHVKVNTPSSGDVRQVLRVRCDEMVIEDAFGNPILTRYGDAQLVPQPVLSGALELINTMGSGLESRVSVDCRPLRISLRQQSINALRSLCSELSALPTYDEDFGAELVQPLSEFQAPIDLPCEAEGSESGTGMFIQRFELSPFMLVLDYLPQRVSVSALRAGNIEELLNIVPFEGVKLRFRHLRVVGIDDPAVLGITVATAYLHEVQRQAGKFLKRSAPIRPLLKLLTTIRDALPRLLPDSSRTTRRSRRVLYRELNRGVRGVISVMEDALGGAETSDASLRTSGQDSPPWEKI